MNHHGEENVKSNQKQWKQLCCIFTVFKKRIQLLTSRI